MSSITEIEKAVKSLSQDDLAKFREWFQEFDAIAWDQQLEEDVKAGKLNILAEEAIGDLRAGHAAEL